MKRIKNLVAVIAVTAVTALSLTGCSSDGKKLYEALNKTQSIKSSESNTEVSLKFSAKGLTKENEAIVAQVIPFINNSKVTMASKMSDNDGKTKAKLQSDINVEFGGTSTKIGFWMDYYLNEDKPVVKEIIKMPAMVTAAMGPEYAGKEYAVMDFTNTQAMPGMEGMDFSKMIKLGMDFQKKTNEFLGKYLEQFNPSTKVVTSLGTKTVGDETLQMYQIKMDDAAFKNIIKYSCNNLLENKDAVKFMKEYLVAVSQLANAKGPEGDKVKADLEKSINDLDKALPEAQKQINKTFDTVKDIKLIGDKGIVINYGINKDGYVVSKSGTIDFTFDIEKLGKAFDEKNGGKQKGIYNLTIDFNSTVKNINKPVEVKMPELNSKNSFNYFDLIKDSVPAGKTK